MKSPIKYRGGKTKEIGLFEKYIPDSYDRFIEPFVGGGAVYFYLEPRKAIINDINENLISFYKDVKTQYPRIRSELDSIQSEYDSNQRQYAELKSKHPMDRVPNLNEDLYYNLRDMYNGLKQTDFLYGTLYFFINKTSYSGMIRFNSKGEYNVPFGRYTNFNTKLLTEDHSKLLSHTEIFNTDYASIFKMASENDFMFLDPPYDCIFNDYGNLQMTNGFDEKQHRRLAQDYKKLKCKALMIIGKTPLTEELYSDYIRDEYPVKYGVNIRNRFDTNAKHIVVMNYD
ncbi:DNA adenine methylase [Methanomethylophilus alvi]|uniref:DNA adenine methylase n=1 Tax=Methanomethylophilus alvi TaxID=1291540 RepID=UPI0037DD500D